MLTSSYDYAFFKKQKLKSRLFHQINDPTDGNIMLAVTLKYQIDNLLFSIITVCII